MNDALSNVLNLPAKMATNEDVIQTRCHQVDEDRHTEQRCHEESLYLDHLSTEFLDSQH